MDGERGAAVERWEAMDTVKSIIGIGVFFCFICLMIFNLFTIHPQWFGGEWEVIREFDSGEEAIYFPRSPGYRISGYTRLYASGDGAVSRHIRFDFTNDVVVLIGDPAVFEGATPTTLSPTVLAKADTIGQRSLSRAGFTLREVGPWSEPDFTEDATQLVAMQHSALPDSQNVYTVTYLTLDVTDGRHELITYNFIGSDKADILNAMLEYRGIEDDMGFTRRAANAYEDLFGIIPEPL